MSNFIANSSDKITIKNIYADKNYAVTPGLITNESDRIRVWAKITTSSGGAVAGAQIIFAFSPNKDHYHIYDMNLTPIATGGPITVTSDANGIASIYITSDDPACLFASVTLAAGGSNAGPIALYFAGISNSAVHRSWRAPSVITGLGTHYSNISVPGGFAAVPNAGTGQLIIPVRDDVLTATTSNEPPVALHTFAVIIPRPVASSLPQDSDFFLVLNDQVAIPSRPDTSGVVNVPYSDVLLDPVSNQMAYFIQDSSGQISQSHALEFGATGVYQNQPDTTQTDRLTPPPRVIPDPGNNGEITVATLEASYGLKISVSSFAKNLLPSDIGSLRAEVYFYMNGYYAATDTVRTGRMYTVEVGELTITETTVSSFTATLPWPYAYGWSKPLHGSPLEFYCEYILRDKKGRIYTSEYISNSNYNIFLNTA